MSAYACLAPFDWTVYGFAVLGWIVMVRWLWRSAKSKAWRLP